MGTQTWTISDRTTGQHAANVSIAPRELDGDAVQVHARTLGGGLCEGVQVLDVTCGDIQFQITPTRGMGLRHAQRGGQTFAWQSPVRGPVHPNFVPLGEPSGIGWLDGFDELLVRCGLESNGAPEFAANGQLKYPLHGRIANRPAHTVTVTMDDTKKSVTINGVVEEIRFLCCNLRLTSSITATVGDPYLVLRDEVENLSGRPAEFQLLYHINFGHPLLDGGSQILAPVDTLVPRDAHSAAGLSEWSKYAAPQAGFEEQVYFFKLRHDGAGQTQTLLRNATGSRGASLQFNVQQLPSFIVWKNTAALEDGYVTGLEPATNFPNPRSFEGEQGRVVKLAPGQRQAFDLKLGLLVAPAEVAAAAAAIEQLQGAAEAKIFPQPQPGWCAGV